MKEFDKYMELLFQNVENNKNIRISKKVKYGFAHYYIILVVQSKSEPSPSWHDLTVVIDNRNNCIEVIGRHITDQLVIQDDKLTKKWTLRCEEYLNSHLQKNLEEAIEDILSTSIDKSLLRQYKMDKLFNKK